MTRKGESRVGMVVLWLTLSSLVATVRVDAGTCNLGCTPCLASCDGGCPVPVTVRHGSPACAVGGAFNLIGTDYEKTCASGTAGCTIDVPPIRFWQFDSYRSANSGCADPEVGRWIGNASLDRGQPVADGHWVLDKFNWTGTDVDGCIPTGGPMPTRTVAEVSFPDAAKEGTPAHRGLFLIGSVAEVAGGFDFDRIQGADGCNAADVTIAEVPMPEIVGISESYNWIDPRFFDISLRLPVTAPAWFNEGGRSTDPALIVGYQVVWAEGPVPTTSAACAWQPVFDPANPALALGVVPLDSPEVRVSIPGSCRFSSATPFWFALRLVYADASVNQTLPFDPSAESGPVLTSAVGAHAGPSYGPMFENPSAYAGIAVAPAVVASGDPVMYSFAIGGAFVGPLYVDVQLPLCLDDRDFDPASQPWQLTITPTWGGDGRYDRATRTLAITAWGFNLMWDVAVEVRGLYADADDPSCCTSPTVGYDAGICGRLTASAGSACVAIDSSGTCPLAPQIVENVFAVKDWDGSVSLTWDQAVDAATVGYNVWKVTSEDPAQIPLANKLEWVRRGNLVAVCSDVDRLAPACVDLTNTALDPPLVFYQVRGVCADGSEGTAHP